jgi:diguanylate cyclase (GGDEF)-like protein
MVGQSGTSRGGEDGTSDWMLRQQLVEHAKGARSSAAANIFNGTIIFALFAAEIDLPWLIAGYAALLLIVAHRIWSNGKVQRLSDGASTELKRLNWHIEVNTWLLGSWWALTIGLPIASLTPEQQLLVSIVGSGMMGAGTISYRTLERPARIFMGLCGLGSLFALIIIGTPTAYAACGLLACYAIVLNGAITRGSDSFCVSNARERALGQSNETIRMLLNDYEEQGSDWLIEIDRLGLIKNPCHRFAAAVSSSIEALRDRKFVDLLTNGRERDDLIAHMTAGTALRDHNVTVTVGGEPRWWAVTVRPAPGDDNGYRGVITDVTAQRQAEDKVNYMARYDALTDLPNRFLFNENLERALRDKSSMVAVMYLDLDHFKSINDTLGHPVGDKLLKAVARRLEACVRGGDTIARFGGDEFAILVCGQDVCKAEGLADRIIEAIALSFSLEGYDVTTGVSIGIARAPEHGMTADKLLQNADLALYAAKAAGRSRFAMFEPGMDKAAQVRRLLEVDLRSALVRDEMRVHFQPLINVASGATSGYEALVRWEHHSRGTVMPSDFIPIAEETGMVVKIGEWVIRRALEEAATWPDHLTVSVNLSPAQMRSSSLLPTVINALAQTSVAPNRLEFEITESVFMHDSEANLSVLHRLTELGVRIALDDFGTGYSSLNYLRSFPFDKIKIDRCFIDEIDTREDCRAIVRSVVSLANSLGMITTAEGVERESQLEQLRREGCTEVQGFLFSKAVAPQELSDLRRISDRRRAA